MMTSRQEFKIESSKSFELSIGSIASQNSLNPALGTIKNDRNDIDGLKIPGVSIDFVENGILITSDSEIEHKDDRKEEDHYNFYNHNGFENLNKAST